MNMKRHISIILRVAAGLGILFVLSKTNIVSYKEIFSIFAVSDKYYLVIAFLLFVSCNLIAVFRWKYILRKLGVKVDFGTTFYLFYAGMYFNLLVPSFVAQDIFRGKVLSARFRADTGKVASSVLMDRFSGMMAISLTSFAAYLFCHGLFKTKAVLFSLFILWGITAVGALVIFSRRLFTKATFLLGKRPIRRKLIDFHDNLIFFRDNPVIFFKVTGISFFIQVVSSMSFYAAALALGVDKGAGVFLLLVPIIGSIASIPITPSGIGTRDAAAVYFFSLIAISHNVAVGLSQFNFFAILINGLFGGILYVGLHHRWVQPAAQNTRS